MADYKGIKGFKVQSLASDPTLIEGTVWYNTASAVLKYAAVTPIMSGTWASGNAQNTKREQPGSATAAPMTTATIFGGFSAAEYPPGNVAKTEEYDGTSWTVSNDLSIGGKTDIEGGGTQTAALAYGGFPYPGTAETEACEYNGSTWTTVNSMTTGTANAGAFGTQTAAICAGEGNPSPNTSCYEYDGTSFSTGGSLTVARKENIGSGSGTQTAGIITGGNTTTASNVTEGYDGTSWSTQTGSITAPAGLRSGAMYGTQTIAMFVGGYIGPTYANTNQIYDGTSWTEGADIANARRACGKGGGTASAVLAGGAPSGGPVVFGSATEEWSAPTAAVAKTVTSS